MEATRVTVDEVKERLDRGEQFAFLDTRNSKAWAESDQKIPNAIRVPADELEQHTAEIAHDRTVITYCTCPHEASSARLAQDLAVRGWKNVHPLYGGFEAWQKAGLPLDSK
jgi:rhodanese-related sulfurtransferase